MINSCTVTNSADSGVRNYINGVKRRGAKVVLTGCGAVSKGRELFNSGIFGVLGASKKSDLNELLKQEKPFFELGNLNSVDKKHRHKLRKSHKSLYKDTRGLQL